ncbi:MAG: hypothetical protein B7Z55_00520 [Planctomycetales bacterium 12-60-4]|nr:MAG: hypothetical protein B7Z55_00520 [Planctomycetales bacterium 12-60-4]
MKIGPFWLLMTLCPVVMNVAVSADEKNKQVLELAPGLVIPLQEPAPIDWDGVTGTDLLLLSLDSLSSDVSAKDEYCFTALRRLLRRGDFDAAARVAGKVSDNQSAEVQGELAYAFLKVNRKADAKTCLALLEQALPAAKEWRKERALGWKALVLSMLEEPDKHWKAIEALADERERDRFRGRWLIQHDRPAARDEFLARTEESAVLPGIDLLVEMGDAALTKNQHEKAAAYFSTAAERALKFNKVSGFEKLSGIVRSFLRHGRSEEGGTYLETYVRATRRLADSMEIKGVLLADAAHMAAETGRQQLANELLAEAEGTIKSVRAEELVRAAAKCAAAYLHPRGKAMGTFWLGLYFYETGLSPEGETLELLKRALNG